MLKKILLLGVCIVAAIAGVSNWVHFTSLPQKDVFASDDAVSDTETSAGTGKDAIISSAAINSENQIPGNHLSPDTSEKKTIISGNSLLIPESINQNSAVFNNLINLFAAIDSEGKVPEAQFLALQKLIETDDNALNQVMTLIDSTNLAYEEKYLLAELISTRKDNTAIDFAMTLMQSPSEQSMSVGAELATSIMMNGRPADILAPIVQSSYSPEAESQIEQVISRVPNASMDAAQKEEVEHLLTSYIDESEGKMKSVAIESLSGLVADDSQKLKNLFEQYSQDESDDVRYSAVEALYKLEPQDFDSRIEKNLTAIANNTQESMSVRASAMQILATYLDKPAS